MERRDTLSFVEIVHFTSFCLTKCNHHIIFERGLRGTTFRRESWQGRHNNGRDAYRGAGTLGAAAALQKQGPKLRGGERRVHHAALRGSGGSSTLHQVVLVGPGA